MNSNIASSDGRMNAMNVRCGNGSPFSLSLHWCFRVQMWPRIISMIEAGTFPVEKVITSEIAADDVVVKGFEQLLDPSMIVAKDTEKTINLRIAEIDRLLVLPGVQVPEVQLAAVLCAEQDFGDQAVLEGVRRAPLARHHRVMAEMPPGVVGQQLRPAIDLPAAANVESFVVHEEDAAWRLALAVGERGDVDALGPAVHRVGTRIAGALGDLAHQTRPVDMVLRAAVRKVQARHVESGAPIPEEIKERMLQQSNERFTLASQAANEGMYDWNLASGRVFFSERLKRMVGRNLREGPKGLKALWRLIDLSDRKKLAATLRQFRRSSRNTLSTEFRVNRPDGNVIWLFATAVAVRSVHSGKIIRVVGSFGDITAKKRSEWAMRLSEARFRSITEAHPVPVMIVRVSTSTIMYASPGAEPLMGAAQNILIGSTLQKYFGEETPYMMQDIVSDQRMDMHEVVLWREDSRQIPVAISARVIDYQGEAAAVLGLYDLSERKQAETQIAKQQEALQQSEKMAALGGLLAGVAHELNNPLSVIVGQATLLKEGSKEPKTISRSEKIFTAAERCSRIVKSFLAIARRKPPEHKLMQLNEAVEQALELLTYQLRTENVQLKLALNPELPRIVGDSDQFTQVVSNLVLNAAQAMQGWQGERQVTVRSYLDGDARQVCLAVSDTGPGIPKENRVRVFEPFFTTKAPGTGTGVGLSLCLNIVTAHGGLLSLQETPGGGANFVISLPVPAGRHEVVTAAGPETDPAPQKLRILLVDDEFELAQTLADLMAEDGHSFDFAVNGQIALEKLRNKEFDLILSDIRMPVMDGPTMYHTICEQLPHYKQRVIFLTGDTLTTFVHDFLEQNPVRFIEKPYTMTDVHRAMTEQLKDIQSQGNNAATILIQAST